MVSPNPDFVSELAAAGGENAKLCFQCGTCTAGCPSGKNTAYRTRKLMRMAQLGLKEMIIESDDLWQCTTCYTCEERCPRGVPIVDVVIALRNIAVSEGHIKDKHKGTAKNLYTLGHTVPINDEVKANRAKLGLPEVPPTVLANEKAMAELKAILDAAGFDGIVKE